MTLETALQDDAIRPEAIEILRSMMERVVVTPTKAGTLRVELTSRVDVAVRGSHPCTNA